MIEFSIVKKFSLSILFITIEIIENDVENINKYLYNEQVIN